MSAQPADVVLTFAFETLDDVRRREFCRPPDQLLLELVGDKRAKNVVIADPWRSRIADVVRRRPSRPDSEVVVGGRAMRHLRPRRLRLDDPTNVRSIESQYARYGRLLRQVAGEHGVLITAHPFVAAWSTPFTGRRCLYYARDDWAGHPFFRQWWPALDRAQDVIGQGDHEIFSVTDTLAERLRPGGNVTVVPNGIAAGLWQPRRSWPLPWPMPGAYAIYSGSIDSRLDLELLDLIAHHPRLDGVLIAGPVETAQLRETLRCIAGVTLLGNLDQATLAAVTMNAVLGVVPHVRSRQTTASSPLKVYEYLAAGLPVVTTDLASVGGLGERVHLCQHSTEWASAVSRALEQGATTESLRQEVVDSLSWRRRLRPIVDSALGVDDRRVG